MVPILLYQKALYEKLSSGLQELSLVHSSATW